MTKIFTIFLVTLTGALLIYGVVHLPDFGSHSAPPHNHISPRYIEKAKEETGVKNIVTSVLADYRGYDTLGEVIVIFTAGISVILLLKRKDVF